MLRKMIATAFVVGLMVCFGMVSAQAQAAGKVAKVPSPELVGQITKGLKVTEKQAVGGAGSIFGYAKNNLKPADFKKVAGAVPGIDGLIKAAPAAPKKAAGGATDMISTVAGSLPGGLGGLASLAGSFKTLGLSPEMIGQFLPIITDYVGVKGGADVANILSGVLK